jgi:feruloyl esterase
MSRRRNAVAAGAVLLAGLSWGFEAQAVGAQECTALANAQHFPEPTQITLTQFLAAGAASANGVPLPAHCRVTGTAQARTGVAGDLPAVPYGIKFEVRLPVDWNGRFMFQGAGGTQGGLSAATGGAGTASPTLAKGFAVASENGGHDNSTLSKQVVTLPDGTPYTIISGNTFYTDHQAIVDWAYNSADVTTRTAKYLIQEFYKKPPVYSYFVGCSTSGRQGMAMSQMFPRHYDGIVAGDPFFVPPHISMSETWAVQQVASVSPRDAAGNPIYWQSYSDSDRALFTKAILESCDGLDGMVDGVIDNLAACRFDPAKFKFADTGQPLQCTGAKAASCLSPAQVTAIKNIERGARTSWGDEIVWNHRTVSGYPYDGGWMEPSGIPTRAIGTATTPPGNLTLGTAQLSLFWFTRPVAAFNPVNFNWDRDVSLVVRSSPAVNDDADLHEFQKQGGKLIFYHGLSDSGPPWPYTAEYFNKASQRNRHGGRNADFMRLYLVPNMGHCGGGPSTDQFDFLTPLMAWVEQGVAPDAVVATGRNFKTAPTIRSRPLCAYPKTARYTGPAGGDISLAANYSCVSAARDRRDDDGERDRDDD